MRENEETVLFDVVDVILFVETSALRLVPCMSVAFAYLFTKNKLTYRSDNKYPYAVHGLCLTAENQSIVATDIELVPRRRTKRNKECV